MTIGTLLSQLKSLARRGLHALGLELSHFKTAHTQAAALRRVLSLCRIDLVVDVGANTGQYAAVVRGTGYGGRILSLEPLSQAHEKLAAAARKDSNWIVGPAVAIGAAPGEAELNISANAVSSSLMPMLDAHSRAAPDSSYVGKEKVRVERLDDVVGTLAHGARVLLKIDSQGYELEVLRGSTNLLPRVAAIQLELSLAPLYGNQPLIEDLIVYLREKGFVPYSFWPVFSDPVHGRLLQCDGMFVRAGEHAGL